MFRVFFSICVLVAACGCCMAGEFVVDYGDQRASGGGVIGPSIMHVGLEFQVPEFITALDSIYITVSGVMPLGTYECYLDNGYDFEAPCNLSLFAMIRGHTAHDPEYTYIGIVAPAQGAYVLSNKVQSIVLTYSEHIIEDILGSDLDELLDGPQYLDIKICKRSDLLYYGADCLPCYAADNHVNFHCSMTMYYSDNVAADLMTWGSVKRLFH